MKWKEALCYKKLKSETKSKLVQCQLCPHFCVIENGEVGKCGVRQNINGKLVSLVYEKPCSIALDPIEKKPLYHFFPGQQTLSIATVGCNLKCLNCQNWEISQAKPEKNGIKVKAEQVIEKVKEANSRIISYTYTDPTIFYEYMIDIAKLAKELKIKNTTVTNGFINPDPLKELCKYLNGSNIDLKSIDDEFYKKICNGRVKPVQEAIKIMKEKEIWIELTNLIIPSLNDSKQDIIKLVSWIRSELGTDVPLHFSAFYPCYKLSNLPRTPAETLKQARKIAMNAGMNYVYTGNISDDEGSTTFCPKCKKPVIKREGFNVIENKLKDGKCICGEKIAGVWQ